MKEEDKSETKLFGVRGPEHGRENIRKTSEMWRKFGAGATQTREQYPRITSPVIMKISINWNTRKHKAALYEYAGHMNTEKAGARIVSACIPGMNKLMLYSVWLPFQLT